MHDLVDGSVFERELFYTCGLGVQRGRRVFVGVTSWVLLCFVRSDYVVFRQVIFFNLLIAFFPQS